MRFLGWHVEEFRSAVTEKGRSPQAEEVSEPTVKVRDALLVFLGVETQDEKNPDEVVQKASDEIARHSQVIGVKNIVIHPFAHLFIELSSPEAAMDILQKLEKKLREMSFVVKRTPFGWFNSLEIKAKGHPLSRIARRINL